MWRVIYNALWSKDIHGFVLKDLGVPALGRSYALSWGYDDSYIMVP